MRIVLDTNVLVSALLSPHGPPARILQLILAGKVVPCFDVRILDECRRVLPRPKFAFDVRHTNELLDFLESTGETVLSVPLQNPLPDADDHAFLEAALAGAAGYLVTGNPRHFPAKLRCGISVLTPAEFLKALVVSR